MGKLYVVRHADAGTRGSPGQLDELRPLSTRGIRQAEGLRDQLARAEVTRLVASPSRRCIDTLAPLAELLGLEVTPDERLAEARGFTGALALAKELRAHTAVICSHGDVIPDLLDALQRRGTTLSGELRWQKASTWVLTRDANGFSHGTYHAPPR